MKFVGLVPMRRGSKGVPGKNTMDFCGLPLCEWSLRQGREAGLDMYVSTDYSKHIFSFSSDCIIERPSALAQDDTLMIDVVTHAYKAIRQVRDDVDAIVLLQPTNPLRMPGDIERAMDAYRGYADHGYPDVLHSIVYIDAVPAGREIVTIPRRQLRTGSPFVTGTVFIYNTDWLLLRGSGEELRAIEWVEFPRWQSFEIDNYEDIPLCEFYMKRRILCTI